MSDLAERDRIFKRGWAAPGGAHDRMIRLLKVALPAAIGVVLAFLAFAPLEEKQEVSFILDKDKVEHAEERMRIQSAQYRGQDSRGRPFVLNARAALQQSSSVPIVHIRDMSAQILLDDGPARLVAERARYNMDTSKVAVDGPILFAASDGYRMRTRDVVVDLRARTLASQGPVDGQMPLGRFSAQRLQVDLPERRAVLSGRARVHIVQGAVG
ncbi:LPS export ABC transporter periplasmic protein LptC [Sphingosinicella terrae]|uniref:LPS export ABC transporter periplasmic protein LptC n=1 Tax=Sphingosinicella terrae TaxID=2172047 RepID=UPI000E0CE4B4|nr:LPS export ABC transporter periplasmic protein LptC [Sphingosinicella terrae]